MFSIKLQESILKLFKGIIYDDNIKNEEINISTVSKFLSNGIILDDNAINFVSKESNNKLLNLINKMYGKDKYLNNTFYKSYSEVASASEFNLVIDRLLHYITTYGFEGLNIYNESIVYIPNKEINLPEDSEPIYFTKIIGYSIDEIKEKVINMINSGIALNEDTINNLINIIKELDFINNINIDKIKNKEIKCILSYELNLIPNNGDDILRTLLYIAIHKTDMIRSTRTFKEIKSCLSLNSDDAYDYIKKLDNEYTIKTISESFLRNKKLWLGFKLNKSDKHSKYVNNFINRLRKQSIHNHKPIKPANNLSNIKYNYIAELIDNDFDNLTKNESIYSKIKAYNYILSLLNNSNYKNYRIRNGKVYSINKEYNYCDLDVYKSLKNKLLKNIKEVLETKIGDNKVYIPNNVTFVAPTSEKKFINGIPELSHININNSLSVGVHWENIIDINGNEVNTDLDLKLIGIGEIIGWDMSWRTDTILFTGDLIVAPIYRGRSY